LASSDLYRALVIPDFRLHFLGGLAASLAMNMQIIARGWLIYELTRSELDLALVSLAFLLPTVLFSLWGGLLADRYSKRRVIVVGQSMNAMATCIMAFIVFSEHVSFWHFMGFGFFNGTVLALSMPSRQAFVPELVPDRLILSATSLNSSGWNFARIVGPSFAGLLIAWIADGDKQSHFGVGVVYLIISALYAVSALTVSRLSKGGETHPATGRPLREMRDAFAYIRARPPILGLIVLGVIPFMFGMPINTLMPAFSQDVLGGGPDDLGFLISAMGAGAIVGSLVTGSLGGLDRKGLWMICTGLGWGAMTIAFGLSPSLGTAFVAILLIGFLSSTTTSLNRSLLQMQVDGHMRGKILSIDMMSQGLMPIGLLPISMVAEETSVAVALTVSGGLFVGLILLCLTLVPAVRVVQRTL